MSDEKKPAIDLPVSLRDWFAGQALAGLLASPEEHVAFPKDFDGPGHYSGHYSALAYRYADAMLAARAPKTEGE